MRSSPSTADQLREAQLRIAALEKEIQALRASHASKPTLSDPNIKNDTSVSPDTNLNASNPTSNGPKSTPATPAAYSDISRDQSQRSTTGQDGQSLSLTPSSPNFHPKKHPSDCAIATIPCLSLPVPTTPITPTLTDVPSALPNLAGVQSCLAPLAPACSSSGPSSVGPPSTSQASTVKRRPPPLPTPKTTSTKKDRPALVAKCVEPRPGQTRYWTGEEHERFLEAIAEYGEKAYVAISNYVETRTPKQVRTHAQKFQMKMARLARQNLEAGQPIQMPRGMFPVIEVPVGSKSTIVPLTQEQSAKLSARASNAPMDEKSIMSAISVIPLTGKKRGGGSTKPDSNCSQEKSGESPKKYRKVSVTPSGAEAKLGCNGSDDNREYGVEPCVDDDLKMCDFSDGTSTVEDDSARSKLAECVDYVLDCDVAVTGVETELESKLAAKLKETLGEGTGADDVAKKEFLVSERSTNGSSSSIEDDLEDLDNLEDGELPLASFDNSENWFLCDSSPSASI